MHCVAQNKKTQLYLQAPRGYGTHQSTATPCKHTPTTYPLRELVNANIVAATMNTTTRPLSKMALPMEPLASDVCLVASYVPVKLSASLSSTD